jgi:hypothetical protein
MGIGGRFSWDVDLRDWVYSESKVHYYMKRSILGCGILSIALLQGMEQMAAACTVCMGANGPLGEAANGAIFVMLGVLFLVLGLISLVGYSLVKKGQAPLPAHAEFGSQISTSNVS